MGKSTNFHKSRLAALDKVRRFTGTYVGGKLVKLTGLERCVIVEILQLVNIDSGYAFPSKSYLSQTIGCDLKVVRSAIDKAIQLGWLTEQTVADGATRFSPVFEAILGDRYNGPAFKDHSEALGKNPPQSGQNPCHRGKRPAHTLDSTTDINTDSISHCEPALSISTDGRQEGKGTPSEGGILKFDVVWNALGRKGPEGPARAAWYGLQEPARRAISDHLKHHGRIDLGSVWVSVFLKGWTTEGPPPTHSMIVASVPTAVKAVNPAAPDASTCEAWSVVKEELIAKYGEGSRTHLNALYPHARLEDKFVLITAGSFIKELVERVYLSDLTATLTKHVPGVTRVQIRLGSVKSDDR